MALRLGQIDLGGIRPIAVPSQTKRVLTLQAASDSVAQRKIQEAEAAQRAAEATQQAELRGVQIEKSRQDVTAQAKAFEDADRIRQILDVSGGNLTDPEVIRRISMISPEFGHSLLTGARQMATQNIAAMEGRPGEEFVTQPGLSETPGERRDDTAAPTSRPAAPLFTAPLPGQQEQVSVLPHQSVAIPGGPTITPRTQQDVDARAMEAARQKAEVEREANTYTITDPTSGRTFTGPKDLIDNLLTQAGQNARNVETIEAQNARAEAAIAAADKRNSDSIAAAAARNRESIAAANGRARASAAANIGGLPPNVQSRVQALAGAFDRNPVVTRFNEAELNAKNVKNIMNSKWSGPGDMALVFEFMRALDPSSVVRESEYETARKTGNWFKGVYARFNGLFNESGGFLSDQVKKDFNAVLQGKMEQASKQVKSMYQDYGRRMNEITGGSDGTKYLTDYSTLMQGSGLPDPLGIR
jgi:hypothetical protein